MFTVNSPLRLMNSLVPSSGSTSQKRSPMAGRAPPDTASSPTTGIPGVSRISASVIRSSACWSAAVTGEASSLLSTSKSVAYTAITRSPAARTMGTSCCSRSVWFGALMGRTPSVKPCQQFYRLV
ncbi:hypothetical protein Y695_04416 [Hydrogenophaga sp. T4]|nr:hypothetical protein Y695_04416 [Hydrogenophaga sp. T4]